MGAAGVASRRMRGDDFWGDGAVCGVLGNLDLGVLVNSHIDLPTVRVGSSHCRVAAESIRMIKMAEIGALEKVHIPADVLAPGAPARVGSTGDDVDVWVWGDEDLIAHWLVSRRPRVAVMLSSSPCTRRTALLSVVPDGVFYYSPGQYDFFASYVPRPALMADAVARYLWGSWEKVA